MKRTLPFSLGALTFILMLGLALSLSFSPTLAQDDATPTPDPAGDPGDTGGDMSEGAGSDTLDSPAVAAGGAQGDSEASGGVIGSVIAECLRPTGTGASAPVPVLTHLQPWRACAGGVNRSPRPRGCRAWRPGARGARRPAHPPPRPPRG